MHQQSLVGHHPSHPSPSAPPSPPSHPSPPCAFAPARPHHTLRSRYAACVAHTQQADEVKYSWTRTPKKSHQTHSIPGPTRSTHPPPSPPSPHQAAQHRHHSHPHPLPRRPRPASPPQELSPIEYSPRHPEASPFSLTPEPSPSHFRHPTPPAPWRNSAGQPPPLSAALPPLPSPPPNSQRTKRLANHRGRGRDRVMRHRRASAAVYHS